MVRTFRRGTVIYSVEKQRLDELDLILVSIYHNSFIGGIQHYDSERDDVCKLQATDHATSSVVCMGVNSSAWSAASGRR